MPISRRFKYLAENCIAAIQKAGMRDGREIWAFARGFIEGAAVEKWDSIRPIEFADYVWKNTYDSQS